MALRDVKEYYADLLCQFLEVKDDLKDFEQGLKDGYITEEQLEDAKEDVENIKNNLDRLSYVLYLFELPKQKNKKIRYKKKNENLEQYLKSLGADRQTVIDENISFMTHLRDELKKLKADK